MSYFNDFTFFLSTGLSIPLNIINIYQTREVISLFFLIIISLISIVCGTLTAYNKYCTYKKNKFEMHQNNNYQYPNKP